MRLFILFYVFFSSILVFKAQTIFNKAYHNINESCNPFLLEIGSNIFYTSVNIDANYFGNAQLYSHALNGSMIYKQTLMVPSNPLLGFRSLDNKIILVGGSPQCDVVFPTQINYITKLKTIGNTVFQCTYTVHSNDNPKAFIQAIDSSYYIFTDSSLVKISKTGQFLYKITSGLSEVSSALLLPNNNFLVSAKVLNIPSFVTVAPTGSILNVVATPTLYAQLSFYGATSGQKIMARGNDGNLYKYTSAHNLIAISNLQVGTSITNYTINKDTLHCLFTSPSVMSSYAMCDTSFNFFFNSATTTQKLFQKAITINSNNKVMILNEGEANITNSFGGFAGIHRYAGINVIEKTGSNNFKSDLALVDVVTDSVFSICTSSALGPTLCQVFLRAKVKVKNVSNTKVTSFKLNCYEYPHVACGVYYYHELFSMLNMNPGDSITVLTNRFIQKSYITPSSSITQVPYCFYVSTPNDEVDKTLNNNELCKSFSFITTGTTYVQKRDYYFKIFPNPFNSELKIESSEVIVYCKIADVFGIMVQEWKGDDRTLNLKTENLKPGVYFLSVETKNGLITKKIIKE